MPEACKGFMRKRACPLTGTSLSQSLCHDQAAPPTAPPPMAPPPAFSNQGYQQPPMGGYPGGPSGNVTRGPDGGVALSQGLRVLCV